MVNKIEYDILSNHSLFESLVFSNKQNAQITKESCFKVENETWTVFKRVIQKITFGLINFDKSKYINWAKGYVQALNQIEQKTVEINSSDYNDHLKVAARIASLLKKNHNKEAKDALFQLEIRIASLENRIFASKPNQEINLEKQYQSKIEEWKKSETVFDKIELDEKESLLLKEFLTYSQFAKVLLQNPSELKRFFEFAFIEKNNIHVFVQFYETTCKIMDNALSDRIGRYCGSDLKITVKNRFKDLTMQFEGASESILDENHTVTFKHNYTLTIREIFKVFKDRAFKVGNLEYFGNALGVTNWNPNEWGSYDPSLNEGNGGYRRVDVKDPKWIKNMPFSLIVDEEEAKKMFLDPLGNLLEFSPDEWVFNVVAKNRFKEANAHGTHMMLSVVCPMGNGKRGIGYLGKFAWDFPQDTKGMINVIFDHVPAAIQWPDENFYQVRRKESQIAFKASESQALSILNKITRNKLNVEDKNMFFQLFEYNCSYWVFKKIEPLISKDKALELAGMYLKDSRPQGVVGEVFSLWRRFPKLMSFIFNMSVRFIKPNVAIKTKRNRTKRVFKLKIRSLPWNDESKRLHPAKIIALQEQNKLAKLD